MKNKFFILSAIAFALFIAFVIYSANTGNRNYFFFKWVGIIPYGDKIGHLCLLGTMSFLANIALNFRKVILKFNFLLGSIIIAGIITIEEFSQLFFSQRTFDLIDLLFNYIGIFSFGKLAEILFRKIRNNEKG